MTPRPGGWKREFGTLLVLFGLALWLRVDLPRDFVFPAGPDNFQGADAWYHVRVVENFVHHPPHRIRYDPYASFPGGDEVPLGPFFVYLLGYLSLGLSLGAPDVFTVHQVAAWLPPILGALATVPVYFLGKTLFGPIPGLLGAGFIATMPGNFFALSILGAADHHVAETLLLTVAILFSILAARSPRPLFPVAAGAALGGYIDTWMAGGFVVGVLSIWILAMTAADPAGNSRLPRMGMVIFAVALLFVVPAQGLAWSEYAIAALVGAILLCGILSLLIRRGAGRWTIFLVLSAAIAGGIVLAGIASPKFWQGAVNLFHRFAAQKTASDVAEARPLLFFYGPFSLGPAWLQFGLCFALAVVAILLLAFRALRAPREPALLLFVLWCAVMFGGVLVQIRMSYYFAINAALLSAWLCVRLLGERVGAALALLVILPNFALARYASSLDRGAPPEWRDALVWLNQHSPEPFGDERYYYSLYRKGEPIPASAYSVMNWWDYGYWILGIAHRAPVSNGTLAGAGDAARFFSSEDDTAANSILERLRSRYVILEGQRPDAETDSIESLAARMRILARWADKDPSRYFDLLYRRLPDGTLIPMFAFYPPYFRTMEVRLSRQPDPAPVWVIRTAGNEITSEKKFDRFEDAGIYSSSSPGLKIACFDPRRNCLASSAPPRYELVYQTPLLPGGARRFVRIYAFH